MGNSAKPSPARAALAAAIRAELDAARKGNGSGRRLIREIAAEAGLREVQLARYARGVHAPSPPAAQRLLAYWPALAPALANAPVVKKEATQRMGRTRSVAGLARDLDLALDAEAGFRWIDRNTWREVHGGKAATADRHWERFLARLRRFDIQHDTYRAGPGALLEIRLGWLWSVLAIDEAVEEVKGRGRA